VAGVGMMMCGGVADDLAHEPRFGRRGDVPEGQLELRARDPCRRERDAADRAGLEHLRPPARLSL